MLGVLVAGIKGDRLPGGGGEVGAERGGQFGAPWVVTHADSSSWTRIAPAYALVCSLALALRRASPRSVPAVSAVRLVPALLSLLALLAFAPFGAGAAPG